MGAVPALGNTPTQRCHALGMTDGRTAALRRNGVIVDAALSEGRTCRDSRRSAAAAEERAPQSPQGAKSETRALLLLRVCAASRDVSSSISSVASADSRCGTAGPPSTAR